MMRSYISNKLMYPSHEFCRKNTTTKIERASFQSFIPLYFTIYNTGFSMTGSSSQAIEIGGSRTERVDSDPSEDMSYIGTPMNVTSPANLIGASFVDVQNESLGPSVDGATATLHEANYQFGNPMPPVKEEDENDFPLLPGECRVKVDGANDWPIIGGTIIVTNYRVVTIKISEDKKRVHIFPISEIETMDLSNDNSIHLLMKGGRSTYLYCNNNKDAYFIHQLIMPALQRLNRSATVLYATRPQDWTSKNDTAPLATVNHFAWSFSEAVDELERCGQLPSWLKRADSVAYEITQVDFERLGMSEHFRISTVNSTFKVCATYPEKVIVPKGISDEEIERSAPYRSIGRFPAVIWRCRKTRAVLLRSSQPQVGILSWRNTTDERIIEEVVRTSRIEGEERKQFIIMDARGYASAFANRARSGGFENTEYYQQAKLEFLGLPNIHAVRSSFTNIRTMLHAPVKENELLLNSLQATGWLTNLSSLLVQATSCADHLAKGHSVLVHCSDGWDRTTQVTTLAKIMLDEHYRTVEGFEELIRRDWIAFGHKLYDRQIGTYTTWSDSGERCPIFLQFLEAVRHLQREQPTAFQFSHAYLIKLAKHAYSGLFGTFLFNSHKEKRDAMTKWDATLVEIWRYIGAHNEEFVNQSYDERYAGPLKTINVSIINLRVWHEVFADEGERYTMIYGSKDERPSSGCATPITSSSSGNLVKSKSSESINSLNVDGSNHQLANASTPATTEGGNLPLSTSFYQQSIYQSNITGLESIDCDGLTKFEDEEQAMLRKKNKAREEAIRLRDRQIEELRRRADIEKMLSPIRGDADDSDIDVASLERASSDLSIMDPDRELPNFRPNTTWEAEAPNCCLCKKEFNKMSVYQEDRQHHCRNCGRVVCEECSKQRFAVVEEGQSVQKRVCDKCYESMHEPEPRLNSGSTTPTNSSPRKETIPELIDNLSVPNVQNVSEYPLKDLSVLKVPKQKKIKNIFKKFPKFK
ncbi:hypothetical protein L3Y34_001609 [Caenorhabditis briggsae]|uniref:phosphatidylinositol-3,5-bisphosphate 3-phosphatase n=1 Tax=Caenorhabditis briggsae TaxID=6238 RepID=A0AAE9IPY5_CAEBR|nr:hypothetical protein L3Y34_001609 [Caenorhabditis briggsae]